MSRKSFFVFSMGFLSSSVVFGVIFFFMTAKPANDVAQRSVVGDKIASKEFEELEKESKEAAAGGSAPVAAVTKTGNAPAAVSATAIPLSQETPFFKTFFSSAPDSQSIRYEVKKGDSLYRIAKKHQVTPGLIKKVNHLADDRVRTGLALKIPTRKLSVLVDKAGNVLILKAGEDVLKTYVVSTGENNSTPVGVFTVTDKLVDPTWYKANAVVKPGSPENVLGTRWLGISKKGYGIHGTTEPEKLGRQVTAGCVRMRNDEVEELYELVPPGTEVTIVDKR